MVCALQPTGSPTGPARPWGLRPKHTQPWSPGTSEPSRDWGCSRPLFRRQADIFKNHEHACKERCQQSHLSSIRKRQK